MASAKSTSAPALDQPRPPRPAPLTPLERAVQALFAEAFPSADFAYVVMDGDTEYDLIPRDPAFRQRRKPRAAALIAEAGQIVAGHFPECWSAGLVFVKKGGEQVGVVVLPLSELREVR